MKKIRNLYVLFMFITIIMLQGCTFEISELNGQINKNYEYEYVINNNQIKLTKFVGEYRTLIEIPEYINNILVTSISKDCFVKSTNTKMLKLNSAIEDNELSEFSTYVIGENIVEIEDGAFEENSTFITDNESKPDGWKDKNIIGSAKKGDGNTYYGTDKKDVIVQGGIVYVKDANLNGLYIARCLTQRKEVVIPSEVFGEKVIDVGMGAFSYNDKIEKVILPNTIGYIYSGAFLDCRNLKEVTCNSFNLSKIMSFSFKGCTSLDVVVIPKNCTWIASEAFSECGEISKLYIPFSMVRISDRAFNNTIVKEIIYGGTAEQWEKIIIAADVIETFNNTYISYLEEQKEEYLESLNEIADLDDNTYVIFEGVITGFHSNRALYVTDPADNYSILCYNDLGIPFTDLDYIGKTVRIEGTKIHFTGQIEVTHSQIEVLDENKTTITPITLDLTDENVNITDYLNKYIVVRGEVVSHQSKFTYLKDIDNVIFNDYFWNNGQVYEVGDTIEVLGWVHTFNQEIEIMIDNRLVKICENNK